MSMEWSIWEQATVNLKSQLVNQNYFRYQLLVHISELVQRDARTGIQRVVRNVLREWLHCPPLGFRVEPIYVTAHGPYK